MENNKELTKKQLFKMARTGDISILSGPRVDKVVDEYGKIPLDTLLLNYKKVIKENFKEMFPWCKLKMNQRITQKLLKDVINMKPSDFILDSLD